MITKIQKMTTVCTELSACVAKIGCLDTALKCSREEVACLKKVVEEHSDWASDSVAKAKEIKGVYEKAMKSVANSQKMMGALHKSLLAAETCNVQRKN